MIFGGSSQSKLFNEFMIPSFPCKREKSLMAVVWVFKDYNPGEEGEIVEKTFYEMDKPGLKFLRRLS